MRTITIGELAAASAVAAGDKMAVEQSGILKYGTAKQLRGALILEVSADHVILDTDPDIIEVTTGATNRTITLPTLADNIGRRIKVVKVDDGAGRVAISRAGLETIDGVANAIINSQYDMAVLVAGSTCWHLEQYKSHRYIADSSPNYDRALYRYADGRMVLVGYVVTSADIGFTLVTFGITFATIKSIVCTYDSTDNAGYAMVKYNALSNVYLYQSIAQAQKIRYIVEGTWR